MNKYEEALEEVLENGGYLDGGKDDYKAPRILREAIYKAEKYDLEHPKKPIKRFEISIDIKYIFREKIDGEIKIEKSTVNVLEWLTNNKYRYFGRYERKSLNGEKIYQIINFVIVVNDIVRNKSITFNELNYDKIRKEIREWLR